MGEECGGHGNEQTYIKYLAAREGWPDTLMSYAYMRGQLNIKMHV
jgi:hypothetical protein